MSAKTSAAVVSPISSDGLGVLDEAAHGLDGVADEDVGGTGAGCSSCSEDFDARHDEQIFGEAVHAGGVFEDGGEELAGLRAEGGLVVEQGFDVAGDGGERGAELVGDVGDEVALGALDLLDAGDVVEDGDGAAAGHGGGVDLEDAAGQQRGGAALADGALLERGADAVEHLGVADGLDQSVADADGAAETAGLPGISRCIRWLVHWMRPAASTATTASCMLSIMASSSCRLSEAASSARCTWPEARLRARARRVEVAEALRASECCESATGRSCRNRRAVERCCRADDAAANANARGRRR